MKKVEVLPSGGKLSRQDWVAETVGVCYSYLRASEGKEEDGVFEPHHIAAPLPANRIYSFSRTNVWEFAEAWVECMRADKKEGKASSHS